MRPTRALLAIAAFAFSSLAAAQAPVKLHAAGSLRGVMSDLAAAWKAGGGGSVEAEYGASGTLRDKIAAGAPAQVFASANMTHPQSLAASGRAGPVSLFAKNQLCALSTPQARVTTDTLLDRLLDPAVKVGTSTPKADPSGDYAFLLFEKADKLRPGAGATLSAKALQLTGGPNSPKPPPDRSLYGMLVADGKADVFLTYCTNAIVAQREHPSLVVSTIPPALAVGADYGITVLNGAPDGAAKFVAFVLSPEGRRIIASHGFALP
ncbi:MAG: molybdate ABC transporter substrate-binding protein [Burkholderiales bacterium]|nr:molybdate ABC transporter substrate-binding protein [Burkholderiales bacterium]MCE7878938.1 molybdate ABC transporter substrate-binding protein [Betaproteobacteria bacterium PRO3]